MQFITGFEAKPNEIMSKKLSTDAELVKLQHESFNYFLYEANPANQFICFHYEE